MQRDPRAASASASPAPAPAVKVAVAVLAAGHRGQGRSRRGGRAHRRRRPRAADAARRATQRAQAGAHADPAAHPPRQARACRARPDRGGHLVVHLARRRPSSSAAARRAGARQPDRRRPVRHAAEPAAGPDRGRAAQCRPRLRRCRAVRGRPDLPGDGREDQCIAAAGVRRGPRRPSGSGRHWSGSGAGRRVRRQGRRAGAARRPRRAGEACRSCRAARPGFIPAAPAPSSSGRRPCSAISANCIRARSRRSTPKARSSAFEVILDAHPGAEGQADASQAGLELSAFQPVSRDFAFVVDRAVKAGDIVRAAQGADRKLIAERRRVRRLRRQGHRSRQEVDRHRGDAAAARQDADRCRRSTRSRPRSSPRSPRRPAARCADEHLHAAARPRSASGRSQPSPWPSWLWSQAWRADFPASAPR